MEDIQETIISDNENNNIPLTKKKRTINAPRSEKQIEAFKKAQEKGNLRKRLESDALSGKLTNPFI